MDYKTGYEKLPPTPAQALLMLPCSSRVQVILDELETIRVRRNVLVGEFERLCEQCLPKQVVKSKVKKARVVKDKVAKAPRKSRLVLLPLED